MAMSTLDEFIYNNHDIVISSVGMEYYINILPVANQDLLELESSILLKNKILLVMGILADNVDPLVSVMRIKRVTLKSYDNAGVS